MPRPCRTKLELADAKIAAYIKARMSVYGICADGAAKSAGMSKATFYNRMSEPRNLTIEELRGLATVLKTTPERIIGGIE